MRKPMNDPATAATPRSLPLAPLDVSLNIEVGRALDMERLANACRRWAGPGIHHVGRLTISLEVAPDLAGRGDARIAIRGAAMTIDGPGVRARTVAGEKRATGFVSRDYLDDPGRLAEEVLEPLVLRLLTREDRTPLHASGIIVDGLAIVLAGPSGSGKSCLARAADAAGLQVLSDDVVYVQTSPGLRVWGWPTAAHLLPEDAGCGNLATRVRNGKRKYVFPLRSASVGPVSCRQAVLCVLARGRQPALKPIAAGEAMQRLWPLDPGFDELPREIAAAVRALSARGAWELSLSARPEAALRLLLASAHRLERTASG
jgi:hypothetical protein